MSYEGKNAYGQYVRLPGADGQEALGAPVDPWASPPTTTQKPMTEVIGEGIANLVAAVTMPKGAITQIPAPINPNSPVTPVVAVPPAKRFPVMPVALAAGGAVLIWAMLRKRS